MTLPRADGIFQSSAPSGSWSDNLWILASRPIKIISEQFDNMAVLIGGRRFWLWRAVDDEGGEASDGRHFLLNLTLNRPGFAGGRFV
jgi:hypothetical protein